VRLMPPLLITEADADEAVFLFEQSLLDVERS
jgi:4-aminobutyrate aminotransferase-like enzyme